MIDGLIINHWRLFRERLPPDKRYARAWSKLYIRDRIGIGTPTHIAGDDMAIAENSLDYRDMSQTARALHAWLQVDDGSYNGRTRDVPAILISARCPLPGVSLRVPGYKCAVKLVIALIGPPGAGGIREDIDPRIRT